ncbi:cytochrome B [Mesorhizobium sp. Root157]|uniref:cytochrome b n=1 Tax=Mesorhizobium sp. Root157 TaxID=1736477 RepID=UPI0006F38B7F|nr:cytochrome b [Mesorhizobium sp. Root157]KQZ82769.1 cytochrome B [Mesorhizobium sp. Root157]
MNARIKNTPGGYGWGAIILHWIIAVLFIGLFALGLAMTRVTSQRISFEMIQLHKSIGFLLLGLVVLRIAWRLGNVVPPLPPQTGQLERHAAPLAHFALYLFQLALPLSGWALVSTSVLAIPSMPFGLFIMPNLPLGMSASAEGFWLNVHVYLAYAGMALVAMHLAAALRHQFWLRDGVLVRMFAPSFHEGRREVE